MGGACGSVVGAGCARCGGAPRAAAVACGVEGGASRLASAASSAGRRAASSDFWHLVNVVMAFETSELGVQQSGALRGREVLHMLRSELLQTLQTGQSEFLARERRLPESVGMSLRAEIRSAVAELLSFSGSESQVRQLVIERLLALRLSLWDQLNAAEAAPPA